jgi:hypothetical protein
LEACRACIGCPNSIVGANYEGATVTGSPFPVLVWQDCCAACNLNIDCAAWVHYTPPTGAQECYLRTSVTRLNPRDPAGNRTITGIMPGWTPPPRYVTMIRRCSCSWLGQHLSTAHLLSPLPSDARADTCQARCQRPCAIRRVVQHKWLCNTNAVTCLPYIRF